MTERQREREHSDDGENTVAGEDLHQREHVDGLVAPVLGIEQRLVELGPVDAQHPDVAGDEPAEQEETEHVLGVLGRV